MEWTPVTALLARKGCGFESKTYQMHIESLKASVECLVWLEHSFWPYTKMREWMNVGHLLLTITVTADAGIHMQFSLCAS